MKVWVLTEGSYSDYSIVGIYSTEEIARRVMEERKGYDPNDPEEWEIDRYVDFLRGPVFRAKIWMDDGKIEEFRPDKTFRHPERCEVFGPYTDRAGKTSVTVGSPISQEHAAKVAVEKRQEWLRDRASTGTDSS